MTQLQQTYQRAVELHKAGRLDDAEPGYRQVVRKQPRHADAWSLLGLLLGQREQHEEAIRCIRRAISINGRAAPYHRNLGVALQGAGRRSEAEQAYRRAIEIAPDDAPAHNNLGVVLQDSGRLDEALCSYHEALRLRPDYPDAYNNIGTVHYARGAYAEAEQAYRSALGGRPDYADALCNLGCAIKSQERTREAVDCFRRALAINPRHCDAVFHLGMALAEQGFMDEALARLDEAHRLRPKPIVRLIQATMLPRIYASPADVDHWRDRFSAGIDQLIADGFSIDPTTELVPTCFLLAYQGRNDRELQEKLQRIYRIGSQPNHADAQAAEHGGPKRCDRIRVGFLSRFFYNHTIAKLLAGVITNLDRREFDVFVFTVGAHSDVRGKAIESVADEYVVLENNSKAAAERIRGHDLDVLFYADIGMDSLTQSLALQRLAPVQCVTWGHPVTTGMATMDYFISSELIEPPDAEDHYSEQLALLSTLPTYFYRPRVPEPLLPREQFGLRAGVHTYLCPQSAFKLHPDFDPLLIDILRRDPAGEVLLLDDQECRGTEQISERLSRQAADVVDRVRFMPKQTQGGFFSVIAHSEVMLDPLHFGGGNTTFEGLAIGTPIVTLPSRYMRGRAVYACYRKMNVLDCVASSPDEYVALAVRLATDPVYRAAVKARIDAASDCLFEDIRAVRELEAFFRHVVRRAAPRPHFSFPAHEAPHVATV